MIDESEKPHFLNFFKSNIDLLKYTGFWFYDNTINKTWKQHYLQLFYNGLWFFYVFIFYWPAEGLYVCYSHNLDEFLRALRDNGNHISLIYKAINYMLQRKSLMEMIVTLENGDYNYESYEDFQPKEIIKNEKKDAVTWTTYFLYFANAICSSMFLGGLYNFFLHSDKQYIILENGQEIYQQQQPVNTVSPFGTGTRWKFFTTFIYTIIGLVAFAWMIVALDSLFITLMSCISAHLKILQGAFKTLRSRCMKRLNVALDNDKFIQDPYELQAEMQKEMTKCLKHLQIIFRVSEKLEAIYNVQTCFQTFVSLGEMCFSLYLLSETIDESIGNEITYLIATAFELLMYCWFGNRITEASVELSYSLYESDWYSTNLSFRKQIIFTMTRMKRPIYVTIGKITPLTFNTFLTMARGAYSFFTFLKQRHGILKK